MIGSCSATFEFVAGGLPALLCFSSGELDLFVRVFLGTAAFVVETIDRIEAFALIALMAGGELGDGLGGIFVRVEARVAGTDGFARPAMVAQIRVGVGHAFATRRTT